MKCIFCKQNSDNSKSVEHIVPESLGNKNHVLRRGIVCDNCNQYFALKIEKEVLQNPYFKGLRHRNKIQSKKRKIPSLTGLDDHSKSKRFELLSIENELVVRCNDNSGFEAVINGYIKEIYFPIVYDPEPNDVMISRFIGKIAIEAIAQKICQFKDSLDEFINDISLDDLRHYVRRGANNAIWPYNTRRIYDELDLFIDMRDSPIKGPQQIMFEYDFLIVDETECYFVCAIMGIEYVINIFDRTIDGFLKWLNENNFKSHLKRDYQFKTTQY